MFYGSTDCRFPCFSSILFYPAKAVEALGLIFLCTSLLSPEVADYMDACAYPWLGSHGGRSFPPRAVMPRWMPVHTHG